MLVLNGYLVLNVVIVTYLLFSLFRRRHPNTRFFLPLVLFSIPAAIGIHTVTAFLYNGFAGRPFWNASILAPRFLASAFCSGPAVLLILMQMLRRFARFEICRTRRSGRSPSSWRTRCSSNLFLLGAEVFKEVYSDTEHLVHMRYMFTGVDGSSAIVPWMWLSGRVLDRGVRALPRPADAAPPRDAQPRVRPDLHGRSTSRRAWAS